MFTELMLAFGMVAVCVIIHVSGLMTLADQLIKRSPLRESQSLVKDIGTMIVVFAIIVVLHMVETAVWATFYQTSQLFPNFETSLYFSLTSYTTIGFGDVVLPDRWRLLGGIEGFSGLLLTGLSTAFLYVIISTFHQKRRGK